MGSGIRNSTIIDLVSGSVGGKTYLQAACDYNLLLILERVCMSER